MYKENYLAAFIERLNSYQIIYSKSFLVLYEEDWFTEVGEMLNEEITLNISLIPSKDDFQYLETVKNSIIKNIVYNENSLNLNKWIEKFDLSKYNFPFVENKEVEQFLVTSIRQDNLDYDKKKIATNMQIDFYCYVAMMEVQKMVAFIDELLHYKKPISQPKPVAPVTEFFPRIFTNEKAHEFFEKLRVEFEDKEYQLANFSFVFHMMKKDGLIFDHLKQLEFVNFLSELNINLDRIKPNSQIGHKDFKEVLYNQIKSS